MFYSIKMFYSIRMQLLVATSTVAYHISILDAAIANKSDLYINTRFDPLRLRIAAIMYLLLLGSCLVRRPLR
jgi:hypothetical protein